MSIWYASTAQEPAPTQSHIVAEAGGGDESPPHRGWDKCDNNVTGQRGRRVKPIARTPAPGLGAGMRPRVRMDQRPPEPIPDVPSPRVERAKSVANVPPPSKRG